MSDQRDLDFVAWAGITPGPWVIESLDDPNCVNVECDGGGCEGVTVAGNDAVANAKAIAAIPDLLRLLERLRSETSGCVRLAIESELEEHFGPIPLSTRKDP